MHERKRRPTTPRATTESKPINQSQEIRLTDPTRWEFLELLVPPFPATVSSCVPRLPGPSLSPHAGRTLCRGIVEAVVGVIPKDAGARMFSTARSAPRAFGVRRGKSERAHRERESGGERETRREARERERETACVREMERERDAGVVFLVFVSLSLSLVADLHVRTCK